MVKYSWRQKKNRNELTEVLLYRHLFLHGRKVYRCMIYLWRYGLVFEKMTGTSSLKKMRDWICLYFASSIIKPRYSCSNYHGTF